MSQLVKEICRKTFYVIFQKVHFRFRSKKFVKNDINGE